MVNPLNRMETNRHGVWKLNTSGSLLNIGVWDTLYTAHHGVRHRQPRSQKYETSDFFP